MRVPEFEFTACDKNNKEWKQIEQQAFLQGLEIKQTELQG